MRVPNVFGRNVASERPAIFAHHEAPDGRTSPDPPSTAHDWVSHPFDAGVSSGQEHGTQALLGAPQAEVREHRCHVAEVDDAIAVGVAADGGAE